MARKPLVGTVANNVLEYGVGGINVDGCRIGYSADDHVMKYDGYKNGEYKSEYTEGTSYTHGNQVQINPEGRFPANIIFECTCDNPKVKDNTNTPYNYNDNEYKVDGFITNIKPNAPSNYNDTNSGVIHTDPNCPCYILDQQSGNKKSTKRGAHNNKKTEYTNTYTPPNALYSDDNTYGDEGGASRFFYCPKASKKDRNEGCDGLPQKANVFMSPDSRMDKEHYERTSPGMERFKTEPKSNYHPTVKPTDLMAYLVRLVTPKGGLVLDPFMGSGSTGKAAVREGMDFIGIEREEEYMEIAKSRIEAEQKKNKYQQFWEV
jgi:site-specific DNA-methyltransferase (adenine-specific)